MINLQIVVADPVRELADYGTGALVRIESGPTLAGPFTEIATIAIVATSTVYVYADDPGTTSTWYRTRFSNAGDTLASAYSIPFQGGSQLGYCSLLDVKARMSGDFPVASATWDATTLTAIESVSDMMDQEVRQQRGQGEGWGFLPGQPATWRYSAARGGTDTILIDDAVAVSSVAILDGSGNLVQTLRLNADYLTMPMNRLPITALRLTNGVWPDYIGAVQVGLTPGYGLTIPPNVRDACIAEVIRTIRGGQAGEDDRLGITPYGSVIVSKALLQSTVRMLARYRFGAGFLRGGS